MVISKALHQFAPFFTSLNLVINSNRTQKTKQHPKQTFSSRDNGIGAKSKVRTKIVKNNSPQIWNARNN
jgi:hypothetical protein